MALSLPFRKERTTDCAWRGDPALLGVPDAVIASWRQDGGAAHLRPYAKNGDLTIITIRDLNADEERYMSRFAMNGFLLRNIAYECFALAARFKGQAESQRMPDGTEVEAIERDANGFLRLSTTFMNGIDRANPGLVDFFGMLIFNASFPSEAVKKASSPPSTVTPLSEAAATSPSTGGEPQEKAPAA
jgi:hypothetical protein